jgi:hypothetical protein
VTLKRVEMLSHVASKKSATMLLSLVALGDEPPSEFRIFTAGKVETSKGTFLFDAAALKRTMENYATQGNELMIDYDHGSLASLVVDPALAGKAAGWFTLEARGGELWAVNVRWTPPALEALKRKEWRYMSPAFETEKNRVVGLTNVALTNIPATRELTPLVAANGKGPDMDPKKLRMLLKRIHMLAAGDPSLTPEVLQGLADLFGLEDASAENVIAVLRALVQKADGTEPAATDPQGANAPAADPNAPNETTALRDLVFTVTGKATPSEALSIINVWRKSHENLEVETKRLEEKRKATEATERKQLCGELVTCGSATPAMVWAKGTDGVADAANGPAPVYARMSIEELRDHVASAKASDTRIVKVGAGPQADTAKLAGGNQKVKCTTSWGEVGEIEVTEAEIAKCKASNTPIEKYAGTKLGIQMRSQTARKAG